QHRTRYALGPAHAGAGGGRTKCRTADGIVAPIDLRGLSPRHLSMLSNVLTPGLIFLVQALVIVALSVVVLRVSPFNGRVPLVVIQIAVGLALGPSLFGRFVPEYYQLFFNQSALAPLSGIGSFAVLVFGLITGLHLDPKVFRGNGGATMAVAAANIVVPT